MLFKYKEKIYVRPFSNKIVEVEVTKNGNEYDVKPTKNVVEINTKAENEFISVSLEDAYKAQNKIGFKDKEE